MQHDEVIWGVINEKFCSFKVKTKQQNFCKNEYNVTGFCNRQSCPLANSRYATIKEVNGICYLYMKTIERAHTPAKLWERIKLSRNYTEALSQIDDILQFSPKFQIHKCKQRLTKITQYLMKMRKLALKSNPKLVSINKKVERREKSREVKAEIAARLEQSIEKELLSRLKDGAYGSMYEDIVNINTKAFDSVMNEVEEELEDEQDNEYEREFVEDEELDEEVDELEEFDGYSDLDEDGDDMESDTGSEHTRKGSDEEEIPRKKLRKNHIEIEYETEATLINSASTK